MRGAVSMANNGPDTNASQFFITYDKQPHLDLKYTLFAKLVVYVSYQHSKLCLLSSTLSLYWKEMLSRSTYYHKHVFLYWISFTIFSFLSVTFYR